MAEATAAAAWARTARARLGVHLHVAQGRGKGGRLDLQSTRHSHNIDTAGAAQRTRTATFPIRVSAHHNTSAPAAAGLAAAVPNKLTGQTKIAKKGSNLTRELIPESLAIAAAHAAEILPIHGCCLFNPSVLSLLGCCTSSSRPPPV